MFYSLINSSRLKHLRAVFSIILIIAYLTAYSGCMTTYNYFESSGSLNRISPDEITKIELIDGSVVNCKDKIINIEKDSDSVKYIVVKTLTEGKNHKASHSEKRISEKDILKIHVVHSEVNGQKTVLVVMGIVIVLGLIVLVIGFAASKQHSLNLGEF